MKKGIWRLSEQHFSHFEEFMILRNFSKRTIKTYMQIVLQFTDWWIQHHDDQPMCDDVVRQYLLYRFEEGKAWQTVNNDYFIVALNMKNTVDSAFKGYWSIIKNILFH